MCFDEHSNSLTGKFCTFVSCSLLHSISKCNYNTSNFYEIRRISLHKYGSLCMSLLFSTLMMAMGSSLFNDTIYPTKNAKRV